VPTPEPAKTAVFPLEYVALVQLSLSGCVHVVLPPLHVTVWAEPSTGSEAATTAQSIEIRRMAVGHAPPKHPCGSKRLTGEEAGVLVFVCMPYPLTITEFEIADVDPGLSKLTTRTLFRRTLSDDT
jgi:hypothetical protein